VFEASILHADADSFYASVAQRDDPRLRGRPVIVGGGVVLAASYHAKACGVRGGMGGAMARRLCPDAVFVSPSFDSYVEASRELFEVFRETAPVVEGLSMEEAFLDVRGLERISGEPVAIANRLRQRVRERVGLPVTVGVARTKVLAKMASAAAKPDGLLVVEPDRETAFLRPLPIGRVWGVGEASAAKLHARGIETVADAARRSELELVEILGRAAGKNLHAVVNNRARARDRRRVRANRRRRSVGAQRALGRGPHSPARLDAALVNLAERVTRRMRKAGRAGRTVTLRLRFGDFSRATRSRTLVEATAATGTVLAAARSLLEAARPAIARRGVTLLGIAVSGLSDTGGGVQLVLPLERRRRADLDRALDEVRDRFGANALTRAALLGSDVRHSAVLLPGDDSGGRL
jgi:DNA polymerase IV